MPKTLARDQLLSDPSRSSLSPTTISAMSSAYADHIVSQTRQNVEFLVSQSLLSQSDADVILSKLAAAGSKNGNAVGVPSVAKAATAVKKFFTPSSSGPAQARAIWDYNADNSVCVFTLDISI